MTDQGTYRIRPAGRHILTIGRNLIQDSYAAVVELVKNAYDADSPDVQIDFIAKHHTNEIKIIISDHGHGMSRDTVINKWMVPSTSDKLMRKISPKGRIMQGRKGVGRYAASILGTDLLLETTTSNGEKTTAYLEWSDFENAKYLDDVEILIETMEVKEKCGTKLTITGTIDNLNEWNKKQFEKLHFELKKLVSPLDTVFNGNSNKEGFQIILNIHNFPDVAEDSGKVESFPIFNLYDYRISGEIKKDGIGTLLYVNQKARNTIEENIPFNIGNPTNCGKLTFDIRVFDREKEAIESLISRGLKDESGNYVGKLQARNLLNEYNGIGVYRNGFRIRPLGNPDFDWLELNKQRVQNPSLRIGSNQAIGYVQIQSEENSQLIEKSARDGLRENYSFENMKKITKTVIGILETRRFEYRKKAGISRNTLKVERELEQLFSYDEIKHEIKRKLIKSKVSKETTDELIRILDNDAEKKNKLADEIREAVAIYQGQATLGKIINVVLHEGRRPLSYFRNHIPRINKKVQLLKKQENAELFSDIISIANGIGENADNFVSLFSRLDPLAAGKRPKRKDLRLIEEIRKAASIFNYKITDLRVSLEITGEEEFLFSTWRQDIVAIFTNLIDNSLFWMEAKKPPSCAISINIHSYNNKLEYIDYRDSGPGIEPDLIRRNVIFDPQFSTKPGGTGLGLAIAGEAAERNGLELIVIESNQGAYFRLQLKE